jgi:outer membrane protein assembly factor BamB
MKMTLQKTKTSSINKKFSTTVLIMILTFSVLLASISIAKAADVKTYAFLSVNPNPVGVNQKVQVTIWLSPIPPESYVDYFHDLTVTITKPDGTTETKGPLTSFAMGGQFFEYTPATTGTYRFQLKYPGETFATTGYYYMPAETPITELVVQQNPITPLPETQTPTDYWTRPINAQNRNWASISGNWLMPNYKTSHNSYYGDTAGGYNPYSQAPRSAHVMWTRPITSGGLAGGPLGSSSYYSGQSYDPYLYPPIVMNGKLYYQTHKSAGVGQGSNPGIICVDLRTGQEIWQNSEAKIDLGQLYTYVSMNGQGVTPFLWDTTGDTWDVYDPFNGELLFSFGNASSGANLWWPDAAVFSEDGSMQVYLLNGMDKWFAKWDSTKAFEENGIYAPNTSPGTYDWMLGVQWNKTIPEHHVTDPVAGLVYPVKYGVADNVLVAKVYDGGNRVYFEIGYDMNTGQEIWIRDTAVQSWFTVFGEGIYASFSLAERTWTGYDIKTGNQMWVSDPTGYPWGSYINYAPCIANGKLYCGSFDGHVYAFDIKTGKLVWKAYTGDAGEETIYGTWPVWNGPIIAGNVVFVGTGEETPTQPLTKGNRVFAFDAETGSELWNIDGYMSLRAIADGYLVGYNGYDNCVYVFGKGPSATTIKASSEVISKGSSVLITGTVTDQSAGQAGTPAIADKDMGAWMEYLKMQQPMPTNAAGVPLTLHAIGPDGNEVQIAQVTSDPSGTYSYLWTPQDQGVYKIKASFSGSDSYGSSHAETSVAVSGSSFANTDLYIIVAAIAVIIAIAIVGILMLKKK